MHCQIPLQCVEEEEEGWVLKAQYLLIPLSAPAPVERAKGGVHCKYTLIHCEYTTVIYVNGNTHSQANAEELLCNGKYDIAEAQR